MQSLRQPRHPLSTERTRRALVDLHRWVCGGGARAPGNAARENFCVNAVLLSDGTRLRAPPRRRCSYLAQTQQVRKVAAQWSCAADTAMNTDETSSRTLCGSSGGNFAQGVSLRA
jgi:hypothetical protein